LSGKKSSTLNRTNPGQTPFMPRANRYILPGHIYHITHRCHDRQFLFKFAKDRNGYRQRLIQTTREEAVSLLNYAIGLDMANRWVSRNEIGF